MTRRVVDAWMQVPPEGFFSNSMFASLRRWMNTGENGMDRSLATALGDLEKGGVACGLISAWSSPSGWMISNDFVAESVRASGGKLVGVGSADLYDPMGVVEEVERCKERGFKAMRVLPWVWNLPPNHRLFYPLYVACTQHRMPFCTQIGHTGPLRSSEPGRPIPYLEDVLLEFPDLQVVGGHVGVPWIGEVLSLLHKFPNFYIDTSAYKLQRLPEELVAYMKSRSGRHRVMFGTNYPMISPEASLQGLKELGLDDETTELFLRGNATRVFGLAAPP
mmetsp:Transcript_18721/g.52665  ORF Transcript_18721/g.52665 Transcript_18721/m.52665 type:complete len:277 (-) Transcript_18721:57-887(-)